MRYDKWQELKPLTEPVLCGTKCVVVSVGPDDYFECGDIVEIADKSDPPLCKSYAIEHCMYWRELALLPSDTAEPAKRERRIVQPFSHKELICALCDDGTLWRLKEGIWYKLPSIPQGDVPNG